MTPRVPTGSYTVLKDLWGEPAFYYFVCPRCERGQRLKPTQFRGDLTRTSVRLKCPHCKTKVNYAPQAQA